MARARALRVERRKAGIAFVFGDFLTQPRLLPEAALLLVSLCGCPRRRRVRLRLPDGVEGVLWRAPWRASVLYPWLPAAH